MGASKLSHIVPQALRDRERILISTQDLFMRTRIPGKSRSVPLAYKGLQDIHAMSIHPSRDVAVIAAGWYSGMRELADHGQLVFSHEQTKHFEKLSRQHITQQKKPQTPLEQQLANYHNAHLSFQKALWSAFLEKTVVPSTKEYSLAISDIALHALDAGQDMTEEDLSLIAAAYCLAKKGPVTLINSSPGGRWFAQNKRSSAIHHRDTLPNIEVVDDIHLLNRHYRLPSSHTEIA